MDDPYLRERGADVKDLGVRVLAYMQRIREQRTQFPDNSILVGEEITPAMLGAIPAEQLGGVVSVVVQATPMSRYWLGPWVYRQ